jgi:hypothetical protein
MSIALTRPHTDALLVALRATGLTVGDAQAPGSVPPYAVLYSIPGGRVFGTLADPHGDGEMVFQVTCVGTTREQTQWVTDKAFAVLSGLSVTGRSIAFVDIDGFPGIQRDDDVQPPLFYSTPRFTITSTPA